MLEKTITLLFICTFTVTFLCVDTPPVQASNHIVEQGINYNTYYNGNHSYTTMYQTSPLNYQQNNQWYQINTTIQPLPPSHIAYQYNYRYGVDTGLYSTYFKTSSTDNYPVAYVYNNTETDTYIRTKMLYAGYMRNNQEYNFTNLYGINERIIQVNDNQVRYENIFPTGIDLEYTYESSMLKEEIILPVTSKTALLNNPPESFGMTSQQAWFVFVSQLDFGTLRICNGSVEITHNYTLNEGSLLFRDNLDTVVASMPVDKVYETSTLLKNQTNLSYKIVFKDNTYYLIIGCKYNRLIDLVFPVVFDPTTGYSEYNTQNGYGQYSHATWATCRSRATYTTSTQAELNIAAFKSGSLYYIRRSFIFIDTSTIPGGVTHADISKVNFSFYVDNEDGGSTKIVFLCDTTEATNYRPGTSMDSGDFYYSYYDKKIGISPVVADTTNYNVSLENYSSFINLTGVSRFVLHDYAYDYSNSAPGAIFAASILGEDTVKLWITYTVPVNFPPVISNNSPVNTTSYGTILCSNPVVCVMINDSDSSYMNLTFRTNASGSWETFGWYNWTGNATLCNDTYVYPVNSTSYWSVNVSDGEFWENQSFYFYRINCSCMGGGGVTYYVLIKNYFSSYFVIGLCCGFITGGVVLLFKRYKKKNG